MATRITIVKPQPTKRQLRRFSRIRASGAKFVMAKGTDLYAEASFVASRLRIGLILDRGENKDHGMARRYEYPFSYKPGDKIYRIRTAYQLLDLYV